jgi:zinc transport system substrate-binding protein
MMTRLIVALGCAFSLWVAYCASVALAAEPVPVFVSVLPQKYFVDKVGGNLVDVSVMVPPGANPHIYEPRPNQMVALSKAKIYFAIGVTFEETWLPKFASANPRMRIVHTEEGIEKISMVAHHHHEEKGKGGGHTEATTFHEKEPSAARDPHVWVSPSEVRTLALSISRTLQAFDPPNSPTYLANYLAFLKEIDELDAELRRIFANRKGMKFMVFHPAWGYFARSYGLEQVPVELEGKEPKPAQLKELIEEAKKEGIKVIFVQPQFSTKSAETIAKAIGGQVVMADNLSPEWARNLREQAVKFQAALR